MDGKKLYERGRRHALAGKWPEGKRTSRAAYLDGWIAGDLEAAKRHYAADLEEAWCALRSDCSKDRLWGRKALARLQRRKPMQSSLATLMLNALKEYGSPSWTHHLGDPCALMRNPHNMPWSNLVGVQ